MFVENKVTFCGTRIENELFPDSCFTRDLAGVRERETRFAIPDTTIKTDRGMSFNTHTETSVANTNDHTTEKKSFFFYSTTQKQKIQETFRTAVENMSDTTVWQNVARATQNTAVRQQQSTQDSHRKTQTSAAYC